MRIIRRNKTVDNSLVNNESIIQNGNTIQTDISDEIKNELRKLYQQASMNFSNIYTLGSYIIAEGSYIIADDDYGSESILIIAGKLNNKRLAFYEGKSDEVSCKIIDLFGFPKQLLETSNTPCYKEGAEYTIPKETMEYIGM